MTKRLFCFFALILCFAASGSPASSAIIVEEALTTWEAALETPTALLEASGKVTPRIVIEYATGKYEDGLAQPADLLEASGNVVPRIVVEYALSVFHSGIEKPDALIAASEKLSPRIVVEYATTLFKADLIYPFEPVPGDFNRNGAPDLADAIRILKFLCGDTYYTAHKDAEVNGDGKVGIEEAIYILREVAQ
ncbi:MAG: dockerin type I repeat-containing protein [Desulfococcaceae bacterium]